MKNLFCLIALTFVFASTNVNANTPAFSVKTKLIAANTINLTLFNLDNNYTRIQISDLNDKEVYYSEFVKNRNGFSKNLNIENLKNGKYLLKIRSNGEVKNQVIKIKNGLVLMSKFS